jgi:acetylglutamate kinase
VDPDVTTLIEALPYIREFRGKTFVIRCAAELSDEYREALCRDIAMLRFVGVKAVLMHPHEHDGDSGSGDGRNLVNHQLVHSLGAYGNTTGLSGSDGAPRWLLSIDAQGDLRANADLVLHVVNDYTPVIEAVAVDPVGNVQAADPDVAAAKLAIALGAYKVILVAGAERVSVEHGGERREVSEMSTAGDVLARIVSGPDIRASVEAGRHAISRGVRFAHIVRGDEPHGLLLELFTDGGSGTKLRSPEAWAEAPSEDFPACGYTLW